MVSSKNGDAPIKINQDINAYSLELHKEKEINFLIGEGRQAYLVQIEGDSTINDIELNDRDGMEIVEEDILIQAKENSHILILEMKKEN
jgi:redox-sensitive bicupin YhaK (pirin superfamily)